VFLESISLLTFTARGPNVPTNGMGYHYQKEEFHADDCNTKGMKYDEIG
jgi:hypothetical protein